MTNSYLKTVEGCLGDLSSFTPEKMEALVGETVGYLSDLRARLESGDPEVRDTALKAAEEVRVGLQAQMESLLKKIGVNPEDLSSVAGSLSDKQNEVLEQAGKEFAQVFSKGEKRPSKPKHNKIKLVG